MEPKAYYEELVERFRDGLPAHLEPRGQVGMSITGGVDSRMIMTWLPRDRAGLPCYSFSGPIREPYDVTVGRPVSAACGESHQVIRIGDDFFSQFPALAAETAFLSDGTMDVTGAVELYVNRKARDIAPIRLTGNYGGEILRRTMAFGPRPLSNVPSRVDFTWLFGGARQIYEERRKEHPLGFVDFKQVPWHHYSRWSIEQSQLTVRSPHLNNALVQHAFRAAPSCAGDKEISPRLIRDGCPTMARIPRDRGAVLEDGCLFDRPRRLHRRFTVKAEYAFDYGVPRALARVDRLVAPLRPELLFLGRNKFNHFRSWYRGPLSEFVTDILTSRAARQRDHVSPEGLRRLMANNLCGSDNFTLELHRLLVIELLYQRLLSLPGPSRS